MSQESTPTVKIKAKQRIHKYAEGVDPEAGKPFETVEKEVTLTGEDALAVLRQTGLSPREALKRGNG